MDRSWPWIITAASAAVLLGRAGGVLGRFSGEDPEIFYFAARTRGLGPVFEPFGGYVHVVPRLVAWLTAWAPVDDAAVVMRLLVLGCWLLTAVVAARACEGVTGDRRIGALAATAVVLAPIASESALGVLANVHFPLLVLVVVLLVRRPDTVGGIAAATVAVLLVGLSDPLAATLVAPAVALDPGWWVRTRRAWPIVVASAVALAVQVPTYLSTAGGRHERNPLLPWAGMSRLWLVAWILPPAAAAATIVVLRARRSDGAGRLGWCVAWCTLYLSLVSHALGGLADRYWVAPSALAVVAVATALRAVAVAHAGRARVIGAAIAVAYAVLAIGAFAPRQFLRDGLAWREAVAVARIECAATGAAAVRIDTVGGAIDAAPCSLFGD